MKYLVLLAIFLALPLAAQTGPTPPSATLSWAQSTTQGVTKNCVYRGAAAGAYGIPALFCSTVPITSYTDATIVRGTTYHYAVTALFNAGQESAYSNDIAVTSPLLNAPTGLNATQVAKNTVDLGWELAQIPGVTRQNVYRQNGCAGKFIKQKQVGATMTSYTDTSAKKGCEAYVITASTKAGEGPMSVPVKITLQ